MKNLEKIFSDFNDMHAYVDCTYASWLAVDNDNWLEPHLPLLICILMKILRNSQRFTLQLKSYFECTLIHSHIHSVFICIVNECVCMCLCSMFMHWIGWRWRWRWWWYWYSFESWIYLSRCDFQAKSDTVNVLCVHVLFTLQCCLWSASTLYSLFVFLYTFYTLANRLVFMNL